jgi:hypothetical protein
MKLSEFRADYYELSAKASDVARSLAFAGIAVIWIFKTGSDAAPHLRPELLPPTALLSLGLAMDLLQYAYAAAALGIFARTKEKRLSSLTEDPELDAPRQMNWPTLTFFWGKLFCIGAAYALIVRYIITQWWG